MDSLIRKSNPTYTDVHVSTPLTNISIARWGVNAAEYKAARIFPPVGVMKQADRFYTYPSTDLRRSQAGRRAPGTRSEAGKWTLSTDSYLCERWALNKPISDPERDNADPQFNLDSEATEFVTDQIALAEENEWTTGFFTTSTWTGGSGGATDQTGVAAAPGANQFLQWNDLTSTPIEVIRAEIYSIKSNTGLTPNQLILGPRVWQELADHPDLLDRIKHTQTGVVTTSLLAQTLDLQEVIILGAVINSAGDGQPEATDFIAGKHALLLYTTRSPGLRTPTAGYSFVWTGNGTPLTGAQMKRFRDEPIESDVIEGNRWTDFKQTSADLGAFFASAVA